MSISRHNLTVIIVSFKSDHVIDRCIKSIDNTIEIIVVDNNSPDKSGQFFSEQYPEVKFILNETNVGVPGGLNIGIRNASGEFVVLLNNDLVVMPNWLDNFFKAYEKPGDALYQPKSLLKSEIL